MDRCKRNPVVCLFVVSLISGCRNRTAMSGEGFDFAVWMAHAWVNCDHRVDVACNVDLMHFPEDYSDAALTRERRSMIQGVAFLRERFGWIKASGPPVSEPKMAALTWAAGTRESWSKCRDTAVATLPVTFSKLSDGYLQTEVCRIGPNWVLKAIHYGLPLANPSSEPMIEMTNRELGRYATAPQE